MVIRIEPRIFDQIVTYVRQFWAKKVKIENFGEDFVPNGITGNVAVGVVCIL